MEGGASIDAAAAAAAAIGTKKSFKTRMSRAKSKRVKKKKELKKKTAARSVALVKMMERQNSVMRHANSKRGKPKKIQKTTSNSNTNSNSDVDTDDETNGNDFNADNANNDNVNDDDNIDDDDDDDDNDDDIDDDDDDLNARTMFGPDWPTLLPNARKDKTTDGRNTWACVYYLEDGEVLESASVSEEKYFITGGENILGTSIGTHWHLGAASSTHAEAVQKQRTKSMKEPDLEVERVRQVRLAEFSAGLGLLHDTHEGDVYLTILGSQPVIARGLEGVCFVWQPGDDIPQARMQKQVLEQGQEICIFNSDSLAAQVKLIIAQGSSTDHLVACLKLCQVDLYLGSQDDEVCVIRVHFEAAANEMRRIFAEHLNLPLKSNSKATIDVDTMAGAVQYRWLEEIGCIADFPLLYPEYTPKFDLDMSLATLQDNVHVPIGEGRGRGSRMTQTKIVKRKRVSHRLIHTAADLEAMVELPTGEAPEAVPVVDKSFKWAHQNCLDCDFYVCADGYEPNLFRPYICRNCAHMHQLKGEEVEWSEPEFRRRKSSACMNNWFDTSPITTSVMSQLAPDAEIVVTESGDILEQIEEEVEEEIEVEVEVDVDGNDDDDKEGDDHEEDNNDIARERMTSFSSMNSDNEVRPRRSSIATPAMIWAMMDLETVEEDEENGDTDFVSPPMIKEDE